MSEPQLMNKNDFASRLKISKRTLEREMKAGRIRPIRIGRRVLFDESHYSKVIKQFNTEGRKSL